MNILFIGTTEIIVIVLVVLLLFGGKKIPELMHGLGKGVKSFKDGVNGLDDKSKPTDANPHTDSNNPTPQS
jgi:sec-independent protein translocase protein TatA